MTMQSAMTISQLCNAITDEIAYAMGFSRTGRLRYLLRPLLRLPAWRFARLMDRFEARVPAEGLPGGCRQLLFDLGVSVQARGAQHIPPTGPLLVVSNHPGAYDSIALAAHIPRPDLHMVVSDIPLLRVLPETGARFIFVPSQSDGRMAALRASIQRLQRGEAVLIFAHGDVEPDPAFMPGAREALGDWSASIEIMLRKVPQAWLQVTIASDVLIPRFVHSPIAHLRRKHSQQQKLGEFMQVIQQLVLPKSLHACARLSFDHPVCAAELAAEGIMPSVVRRARSLLDDHLAAFHPEDPISHIKLSDN